MAAGDPDPDDAIEAGVRAHESEPLDLEDGGTVVIRQQNAGAGNQVGGGEFKSGSLHKTPDEAAAEQEALEREVPIDDHDGP